MKSKFLGLLAVGLMIGPMAASADGVWRAAVAAPEIDPASALGGLTLLLSGLAVLRGRRRSQS
jgi:hypothetical protein